MVSLFFHIKSQAFQAGLYMCSQLVSHFWPPVTLRPDFPKKCLSAVMSQSMCLFNELLPFFLSWFHLSSLYCFKVNSGLRILVGNFDVKHLPPTQENDVLVATTQCI